MVISSSSKLVTSGEPDAGALPPVGLTAEELARAALKTGDKVATIIAAAAPTRLACRNARRFECENIFGSLEVEFLEAGPADFRIRVDSLDEAGRMRDEIPRRVYQSCWESLRAYTAAGQRNPDP